ELVRELIDRGKAGVVRAALGQHELVVIAGRLRQEHQLGVADGSAVRLDEAEDVRVEPPHGLEIDHPDPDMTEREYRPLPHRFSLRVSTARARTALASWRSILTPSGQALKQLARPSATRGLSCTAWRSR